jgi:hypothetical protein
MGAPTTDAGLIGLYKTWYTDKQLANLLFRNSPVVAAIPKKRIGGKEYKYAMLYGRGGAVAGDATIAAAVAATTAKIAEAAAGIGKIFSVFTVTNLEKLASQDTKGAYAPAAVAKMFAALEGARKTLATAFYGSGCGEITTINNGGVVAAGEDHCVMSSVIGFEVGTRFVVTSGPSTTALPSSALVGAGAGTPFTVTAIDDATKTVYFDPVVPAATFVDLAWVNLYGSRDGAGVGCLPEGLGAMIPSYFSRTGASWIAYIGTAFRGITRSASVSRLAGNYYKLTGGEHMADALIHGIMLARRQGGVPDMIVMNDEDMNTLTQELQVHTNYMQMINTGDRSNPNEVTSGLKTMAYIFSTSYLKIVQEDPYCPKGKAYILDSGNLDFITLTDAERITKTSISDNDPGSPDVAEAKDPTDQPFQLNIEDYLTEQPSSLVADGAGAQVLVNIFGNFVVYNPAHNCVVEF